MDELSNGDLAYAYYYVLGTSQAFSRPEAQQYLKEIETTGENIAAYFQEHGSFEGLNLSVSRRTLGIMKLILTQGANKAKEQVRGTTIGSLDRLMEEVLDPGSAEKAESLYSTK